jgi:hypothetical protein
VTVEETQDTIYLVLPSTPTAGGEGAELSDRELKSVAGGVEVYNPIIDCNNTELWLE